MTDCPNCGQQVDETAAVCSNCGFDIHSRQVDEVRRLREEGRIHPGRLGAQQRENWSGGDPGDPDIHEELPAEDWASGLKNPGKRND
jgi:zinc-ribbon domain